MSVEAHVAQLQQRHASLEEKLEELVASPSTTDTELSELKRQKLQLKDEIHRLEGRKMVA